MDKNRKVILTEGILAFGAERCHQILKHGFTAEHHRSHPEWYEAGQLRYAAQELSKQDMDLISTVPPTNWDYQWWTRLRNKPHKERLEASGAMLAAEYERLYTE